MSHHVVMTQHAIRLDREPTIGFGDRLRRLRLAVGLEQRDLAEILGVTSASISRWENGGTLPRMAPAIAATMQLQYGSSEVDLRSWLLGLPHLDSNQEPADSLPRGPRHLTLVPRLAEVAAA